MGQRARARAMERKHTVPKKAQVSHLEARNGPKPPPGGHILSVLWRHRRWTRNGPLRSTPYGPRGPGGPRLIGGPYGGAPEGKYREGGPMCD